MADDDPELLRDFLTESEENLDQLDRELVALEREPTDAPRLAAVFRCVHTIKGSAGFFGFVKLEALAHAGETLLARLRDGEIALDATMTSALLQLLDAKRRLLKLVATTGAEGSDDWTHLAAELARLGQTRPSLRCVRTPGTTEAPVASRAFRASIAAIEVVSTSESTVRVDVEVLDRVMNLVGELVLTRNRILRFTATGTDAALTDSTQRLDALTAELQASVMKARMQPIGNVWNKYPRIVRDLATMCGKRVRLDLAGLETELDRTVIEAIRDPLIHAVRNAVDHGIETPDRRLAAGKPETGALVLRAFHEAGQIHILVSDDGAGLDVARIRDKAVERGLVTREDVLVMSDPDVMRFVFHPGFSMATEVTKLSGRGVGMDVVKTQIERVGGTVDLVSERGRGTTLRFKVPLTLAIVAALLVRSAGERFAIPQVSLLELVRLSEDEPGERIEEVLGTPVYRLRGDLLPLVRLDRALGIDSNGGQDIEGTAVRELVESGVVNIVVVQAHDRRFGLIVDAIEDTEEIVVKPLGRELRSLTVYSGATLMGDGNVALILDVLGIAERTEVTSAATKRALAGLGAPAAAAAETAESLLLFQVGAAGQIGLPMTGVTRLENVRRSVVETSIGGRVIQHRGEILAVIDLSRELGNGSELPEEAIMIVCRDDDFAAGILVDRILDIVDATLTVQCSRPRAGLLGAAVVQGKVTDIIDLPALLRRGELLGRAA